MLLLSFEHRKCGLLDTWSSAHSRVRLRTDEETVLWFRGCGQPVCVGVGVRDQNLHSVNQTVVPSSMPTTLVVSSNARC